MIQAAHPFSFLMLMMIAACASCSWPGWTTEKISPDPKVKYEASWWSDRSEPNVRDEILERRKELIDRRAREIEELSQLPEQPPPTLAEPPKSETSMNHLISRIPAIEPDAEPDTHASPPAHVHLAQHAEPIPPVAAPRRMEHQVAAPLRIEPDERITSAVKLRAIIEDANADAIALLEISGGRSAYVRRGDVIDVESGGRVLQARINSIARDTVYIQTSDNPDTMVAVR